MNDDLFPSHLDDDQDRVSTLKELLRDKPKRGRPPRMVSRQNVYVALHAEQKKQTTQLAAFLPDNLARADVPDLAVSILTARMEALRLAVAGRTREIPEGITDLDSMYLLWDLPVPPAEPAEKWTSIRLSPSKSSNWVGRRARSARRLAPIAARSTASVWRCWPSFWSRIRWTAPSCV